MARDGLDVIALVFLEIDFTIGSDIKRNKADRCIRCIQYTY